MLAEDDARWAAFGLEAPADRRRRNAESKARLGREDSAKVTSLPVAGAAGGEAKAA
jgi:hypothetical protein